MSELIRDVMVQAIHRIDFAMLFQFVDVSSIGLLMIAVKGDYF